MNNNEHVNKNIIIAAAAATTAYAVVGLSIICLMMDKAVKDLDKASKKIERFVDKHTVKKSTPAPNVKPECWDTGKIPNNTNEEIDNSADDVESKLDTITEHLNNIDANDPTPWDAPLE